MWDGALAGMLADEQKRQAIKHSSLADLVAVQGLVGAAQDREYKNAERQRADAFGQALVKLSEAGKPLTRENILPLALENRQLAPKDFLSNDLGQERLAAQQKISRDRLNAMYQIAQDKLKASGAKADPANVARYMAALSKYNHDLDTLPEAMHGSLVMPTPEMFNLGGNPAVVGKPSGATISPTVTPAEIMRIQDPADRAAAMEALQAGRFAQPVAQVAPTSPVASPAPTPAAPVQADPNADHWDRLNPQPSKYAGMTNVPTPPVPTDNAVAKPEPVMPKFTGSPKEIRRLENDWKMAQGKGELKQNAPTPAANIGEGALDMAASRYLVDGTLPSNTGRGAQGYANTNAILERAAAMAKEKGMDGEATRISQLAAKSISTGLTALERQRATVMAYEKTALAGADIALEMSDKVARDTNIPIIDKWIQAGRKNIAGDPDISRLHNATETLTNEYAKVMSGSSGGQATTVSMQEHARQMLNGANTKEQFRAVVELMKREMTQTREKAFDDQIKEMKARMVPPSSSEGKPNASPVHANDKELKDAQAAIAKGAPRAAVAAEYKKRTGMDLP